MCNIKIFKNNHFVDTLSLSLDEADYEISKLENLGYTCIYADQECDLYVDNNSQ